MRKRAVWISRKDGKMCPRCLEDLKGGCDHTVSLDQPELSPSISSSSSSSSSFSSSIIFVLHILLFLFSSSSSSSFSSSSLLLFLLHHHLLTAAAQERKSVLFFPDRLLIPPSSSVQTYDLIYVLDFAGFCISHSLLVSQHHLQLNLL